MFRTIVNKHRFLSFSDMSNRANLSKHSPATPVYQEPTPGPRQQHRKGGHKKKKGGRF